MKSIFICLPIALLAVSCSTINRKLYSPTQPNNPSLQAKNDYSLGATYSSPSGFDINGGYAITDRIAVIGGLHSYKNKDREEKATIFSNDRASSLLKYKHNGFHAGVGYYFPISRKKSPEFLAFFSGYSNGKFEMNESMVEYSTSTTTPPPPPAPPKLNSYTSNLNRWFLQGSYNMYDKLLHLSLITRFSYAGYNKIVTDYTTAEQVEYRLPDVGYKKWSPFFDFTFDTKIFFSEDHRFGMQFFGTISIRTKSEDFNFSTYPFRAGIGLVFKSPFKKAAAKKD